MTAPSGKSGGGVAAVETPAPAGDSSVIDGLAVDALLKMALEPGAAAGPSEDAPLRLGDYEMIEQIGRGGMGVVYRARQLGLGREVAVKVITAGTFADEAARKRFRREAETAARLSHPSIVRVYEVGEDRGQPFFSMEYVEGPTLADRIRKGQLPWREACALVAETAEAVDFAHRRGVLHRDLKPGNVLIDPFGRVRITDFGLSSRMDEGQGMTVTGEFLGTPDFTPLEQVLGRKSQIGVRSEVYSLGAILYCALTGRPPFEAPTVAELADRQRRSSPAPPRKRNPSIPRDLDTVCLKCLETDLSRRYATARDLADELHRVLNDQPVRAREISGPQRLVRWCRRNPAAAATILLLLGTAAALTGAWYSTDASRREAERRRAEAEYESYVAGIGLAASRAAQGSFEQARQLLLAAPPGLRHWEWGRVFALCESPGAVLAGHTKAIIRGAQSRNGKLLATASYDNTVRIWKLEGEGEGEARVLAAEAPVRALDFSPDAVFLAGALDAGGIQVWRVGDGKMERRLPSGTARVAALAWLQDSDRFLAGDEDGVMRVWSVLSAGGAPVFRAPGPVAAVAVAPDGQVAAVACADGSCRLVQIAEGRELRELPRAAARVQALAFSPDGKWLAAGAWDGITRILNTADGALAGSYAHDGPVTSAAFTPDGRRVVTGSLDFSVRSASAPSGRDARVVHTHDDYVTHVSVTADGAQAVSAGYDMTVRLSPMRLPDRRLEITAHGAPMKAARFLRDGVRLVTASQDGVVIVWDANTGREMKRFSGGAGLESLAVSPVEDVFVTGHGDGEMRFRDATSGRELRTLKAHPSAVWSLDFSPDGRRLASAGRDGTARTWSVADTREIAVLSAATPDSPDGPACVAFAPEGGRVAVGHWNGTILVADPESGRELHVLRERTRIRAIGFLPDGLLAVASDEPAVRLLHPDTGEAATNLRGHNQAVRAMVVFPDGRRVVTAGGDGTARVWDPAAGRELLALGLGGDGIETVAFSRDLRALVTGHRSGRVIVWFAEDWSKPAERIHDQRLREERVRRASSQLYAQIGRQAAYSPTGASELPGRSELLYVAPHTEGGAPQPLPPSFLLPIRNEFDEPLTGALRIFADPLRSRRIAEIPLAIAPGREQTVEIPLPAHLAPEAAEEMETPAVAVWDVNLGPDPVWSGMVMPILVDAWPFRQETDRVRGAFRFGALEGIVPPPGQKVRLEIPRHNPLRAPVRERLAWRLPANRLWTVTPAALVLDVPPDQSRTAVFEVLFTGTHPQLHPLPEVESAVEFEGSTLLRQTEPLPVNRDGFFASYKPVARCAAAPAPPGIDGRLDEGLWHNAPVATVFLAPDGSGAARQQTEARFAADGANLYAAFRMLEPNPERVQARQTERDVFDEHQDCVEWFLSPPGGAGYFQFVFNPGAKAGDTPQMYDLRNGDNRWNAPVEARAGREARAWTVEVAIPWAALDMPGPPAPDAVMGLNVVRTRAVNPWEKSHWAPNFASPHQPGRWGVLRFDPAP